MEKIIKPKLEEIIPKKITKNQGENQLRLGGERRKILSQ